MCVRELHAPVYICVYVSELRAPVYICVHLLVHVYTAHVINMSRVSYLNVKHKPHPSHLQIISFLLTQISMCWHISCCRIF